MAYSRWGCSYFYTYWSTAPGEETRDTAVFEICTITSVTAKQLRDDMEACVSDVKQKCSSIEKPPDEFDIIELRACMMEFLDDVDRHYAKEQQ